MLLKNKHILKEKERNTKMVTTRIRFTSLVLLGLFLVMMHALRDFSAYAHQGKERNGNVFSASEENNVVFVPKENVNDGGTPAAATSEIGLGGRKMARVLHKKVLRKDTTEKELQGLIAVNGGTTAQIFSGSINDDASKKSFRRSSQQLNDQSKFNMLEPTKKTHEDPAHDDQNKDEAQRLLLEEAANEMVNLMHKDYKGRDKPRRKPPVNNHEPSD